MIGFCLYIYVYCSDVFAGDGCSLCGGIGGYYRWYVLIYLLLNNAPCIIIISVFLFYKTAEFHYSLFSDQNNYPDPIGRLTGTPCLTETARPIPVVMINLISTANYFMEQMSAQTVSSLRIERSGSAYSVISIILQIVYSNSYFHFINCCFETEFYKGL